MRIGENNGGRKRGSMLAVAAVAVGAAAIWGFRAAHSAPAIPTALVQRAPFVDWVELHGQVEAPGSALVTAGPTVSNFRILKLASNGSRVKKGDAIAQFDATQLEQDLAQARVALKSAEATLEQAKAAAKTKEDADLTALLQDQYNVQQAQLEASKAEIVSQIEGEENRLKLADARAQLKAGEATLKSDQVSDAADIHGKEQAREEAASKVLRDETNLGQLTLRAPRDGVVSLLRYIWDNTTQQERALRPGDNIWPGAPIAEMPDLSKLDVEARVEESDRGRLAVGQHVEMRFSAIPSRSFAGRVESISTIASIDYNGGWPLTRNFTVQIALEQRDPQLLPDESGTVRVAVDRVAEGIVIPLQAVFARNGERTAYVLRGAQFEPRTIVVAAESGGEALIAKGLAPGERVALKNPAPQS